MTSGQRGDERLISHPHASRTPSGRWLADQIESWLLALRSEASRVPYERALGEYLADCDARDLDPLAVRTLHLSTYRDRLARRPCSRCRSGRLADTTRALHIAAISSFYAHLAELGEIRGNPAYGLTRPRVDRRESRRPAWSRAELAALRETAATARTPQWLRNRAMVEAAATLGLRAAEECSWRVDTLTTGQDGVRLLVFFGKGGKRHPRPCPASLAEALDSYLAHRAAVEGRDVADLSGPLFVTSTGQPVTRQQWHRIVKRLCRRAGVSHGSPHTFRAAFATHALDAGADVGDVATALGHSSVDTTRRYDRGAERLERDPASWLERQRADL